MLQNTWLWKRNLGFLLSIWALLSGSTQGRRYLMTCAYRIYLLLLPCQAYLLLLPCPARLVSLTAAIIPAPGSQVALLKCCFNTEPEAKLDS